MTALEFRGLSVHFGRGRRALAAVDGVDLTVPSGSVVGLVGESGSGKSTLGRAAVGLVPVTCGQVLLDGTDVVGRRGSRGRAARRVQMVFQDPYSSLDPRMTVGRTVAEAVAAHRRLSRAARTAEVRRLLELVQLDARQVEGMLPRQLSGGQRQRVAIARVLATEPDVVVADEITSALDVSVQGAVLNLLRDLQRRLGLTVLFISHDLAVVRHVSDTVAVMYLGRIVETGPVEPLLASPRHPYTEVLVESLPRAGVPLDPGGDGGPAGGLDQEPPDPHAPPPGCRFHPRCPYGPRVRADRGICAQADPQAGAAARSHRSACHFADELRGSQP